MTGMVKTKEIAAALGRPRKSVLERAEREGWPNYRKSGGALLWVENRLPLDVRLALSCNAQAPALRGEEANEEADLAGHVFARASEKSRETAVWRGSLIMAWKQSGLRKEDFIESYNAGVVGVAIREHLGNVSLKTFYRWLKEFKSSGPSGITPRYGMVSKGDGASLTETEKELLAHFWLQDTQPTVMHALTLMRKNAPYSRCTYQTALRYVSSIPQAVADYYRLGRTKFANRHLPFIEQNVGRYKSLEVVVSDHHCLDVVVRYRGKLIRPWVTTFQDYRSGKILGWCPSVKPSSLSIIAAYYLAVIQYGVPRKVLFDNGKDYRSALLNGSKATAKVLTPERLEEEQEVYIQGLFSLVGSDVSFTDVYNGKSKGRQERYYGLLGEYFSKDVGGYIGHDTTTRPEDAQLYFRSINKQLQRSDVPEWNDLVEGLGAMIQYLNDNFASHGKGMGGKTPSRVFEENLPAEIRRADKETLRLALSRGELRCVRNQRVEVGGIKYYHPDLLRYSGSQVIVRQKLTTDSEVTVCDLKGAVICTAIGNYFAEGEDIGASIERLRHAKKDSLRRLAELGSNEVAAAPEYETMVDVARNMYRQNELVDVDEYLALPKAVGAEGLEGPGDAGGREKEEAQDGQKPARKKLKNLLDATAEDYTA